MWSTIASSCYFHPNLCTLLPYNISFHKRSSPLHNCHSSTQKINFIMEVINFLIFIVISSFFYSTAAQEPCSVGFKQCSPAGASRREVPVIGPDLARFYLELVYTVRIVSGNSHAVEGMAFARQTDPGDSLCCKCFFGVRVGF